MLPLKAIPTRYAGVLFRSRLEARWAALFDQRGDLTWEYEPVDFDGWFPDFCLKTRFGSVFVEVKPVEDIDVERPHFAKAVKHWKDVQVLLLGMEPSEDGAIGFVCEPPLNAGYDWRDIHSYFIWSDSSDPEALLLRWREASNLVRYKMGEE